MAKDCTSLIRSLITFPEIFSHDAADSRIVLNKDEDAIERSVGEPVAHDIAVVICVSLALDTRAIEDDQLVPLVEDLILRIGPCDRVGTLLCVPRCITDFVKDGRFAYSNLNDGVSYLQ